MSLSRAYTGPIVVSAGLFAMATFSVKALLDSRCSFFLALLVLLLSTVSVAAPDGRVALSGHLAPLQKSFAKINSSNPASAISITLVLKRSDEAGFQRWLQALQDPRSADFERYLTPQDLAERFGPSQLSYAALSDFMQGQGFGLSEGSANRMTLTFNGTRATAERAFATSIHEYQFGDKVVFANASTPSLPGDLAVKVAAVIGLNNLAQPQPLGNAINGAFDYFICTAQADLSVFDSSSPTGFRRPTQAERDKAYAACVSARKTARAGNSSGSAGSGHAPSGAARLGGSNDWRNLDGTGERVAIIGFDTFLLSDVENYLALMGFPAAQITRLSRVAVNGGAPLGETQTETLLDIAAVFAIAPGADVVVYDAPFSGRNTSFQTLLNAAISGGADVISNSWAYCENQTIPADVLSIESIVQSAAASGISVLSASGDTGSTCLNGAANTIVVPAGAPSVTAVGGSSLTLSPGSLYGRETWWGATLPSGQPSGGGGFGVSRFFSRPAFQNGLNLSSQRSIPDVVVSADPFSGVALCQQSDGGCPTGKLYGGTSIAAPIWAGYAAVLNQARSSNLGALNPRLYAPASAGGFFNAASMGSDFAHVGLGSPNVNRLHLALNALSVGPATAQDSEVYVVRPFQETISGRVTPADGETTLTVVVRLRDVNGNPVPGKSISLAVSPAADVSITPDAAVTTIANGAAEFQVSARSRQVLTFTATNTTDGFVIGATAQTRFAPPPAASGAIAAFPNQVTANGLSTATIQVVLRTASGLPASGKVVRLVQTGTAVINGSSPALTNDFGIAEFTASNIANQTVTFGAFVLSDGDLPVPVGVGQSNVVAYSNSPNTTCVGTPPQAAPGYAVTTFASGFVSEVFSFGNINFGCSGATNPAFTANGDAYVSSFRFGDFFRFSADGGAANAPLSRLGPTLAQPIVAPDGKIYAARSATTGNFFTGAILELDPLSGAQRRVVAANLTCPQALAIDPLSGDLFYSGICFGAGSDDARLYRISDPGDTNPNVPTAVSVYATLPSTPNGQLAIAPNGDIYMATAYTQVVAPVVKISRTNQPQPPTISAVPGVNSIFFLTVGAVNADGTARTLFVQNPPLVREVAIAPPNTATDIVSDLNVGVIGPDGCMYSGAGGSVYKIAPAAGPCAFRASSAAAAVILTPAQAAPDPLQGSTLAVGARVVNRAVPVGTMMQFTVTGANPQLASVPVDASGAASFTLVGIRAGRDEVRASALGVDSNRTRVTWISDKHTTALSFNGEYLSGTIGTPVVLAATLSDISVVPAAPVASALVRLDLGNQFCTVKTGNDGRAACTVTQRLGGNFSLRASFVGTAQLTAASAATGFTVFDDVLFADGFQP